MPELRLPAGGDAGGGVCPQRKHSGRGGRCFIQESYQSDASLQITPEDLVKLREVSPNTKLLDVRSREEHEAVAIPGSHLVSQELIQVIFDQWNKTDLW